jgi:hypothetical protein
VKEHRSLVTSSCAPKGNCRLRACVEAEHFADRTAMGRRSPEFALNRPEKF